MTGRVALRTLQSAIGSTRLGVLADGAVPLVTGVAVGVTALVVDPAPVGVDGDFSIDSRAGARSSALLPSHLGMRLGLLLTHLLSSHKGQEGGEGGKAGVHRDE